MTKQNPKVTISPATPDDLAALSEVGYRIWRQHYPGIISQEQIEYMLAKRYSIQSLRSQIELQGHRYYLARREGEVVGFVSFACMMNKGLAYLYVHRLYLLPELHGQGIGKMLMDTAVGFAKSRGHVRVRLNVHRKNPARHFYLGYGFHILEEVDIPYGPYWLNDYTMEFQIAQGDTQKEYSAVSSHSL